MSSDPERREFLLSLVQAAIAEHDRWARRDDLAYVSGGLDEAMTYLADGFSEGSIPGDCRDLHQRVSAFADEWHTWQRQVDQRGGDATIPPAQSAWKAWEAVVDCYQGVVAPTRKPVESIATLRAQQVPDRQICEIYGWVDSRGTPETWKVDEELATPGKHTTGWIDPIERRRQEAQAKAQSLVDRVRQLRDRKLARMTAEPPESLADLIRGNVPLHQVAQILRISEAEVLERCETERLPRPPIMSNLQSARSQFDPDLPEPMARQFAAQVAEGTQKRADMDEMARPATTRPAVGPSNSPNPTVSPAIVDGGLTLEQQIIQHHQEGFSPSDIAEVLTSDTEKVTSRKVQAVIKRFTEDPDAFGVPE